MNVDRLIEIADKKTKVVDGKTIVFRTMTGQFETQIDESGKRFYIVDSEKGNHCYIQQELDAALGYMPYADVYELHVDDNALMPSLNNDGRVFVIKEGSKAIIGDIITSEEKFQYFINKYHEKGKSR
jgi:hypothetical protein